MAQEEKQKDIAKVPYPYELQGGSVSWTVFEMKLHEAKYLAGRNYYFVGDDGIISKKQKVIDMMDCWDHSCSLIAEPVVMMELDIVSIGIYPCAAHVRKSLFELKADINIEFQNFENGKQSGKKNLEQLKSQENRLFDSIFENNIECYYNVLVTKSGQNFLIELANNAAYKRFAASVVFDSRKDRYLVKDRLMNVNAGLPRDAYPILCRAFVPLMDKYDNGSYWFKARPVVLFLSKEEKYLVSGRGVKITRKNELDDKNFVHDLTIKLSKDDFEDGNMEHDLYVIPTYSFGFMPSLKWNDWTLKFQSFRNDKNKRLRLNKGGMQLIEKQDFKIMQGLIGQNKAVCCTEMCLPPNFMLTDDISTQCIEAYKAAVFEQQWKCLTGESKQDQPCQSDIDIVTTHK